jgi:hypothetical protein
MKLLCKNPLRALRAFAVYLLVRSSNAPAISNAYYREGAKDAKVMK